MIQNEIAIPLSSILRIEDLDKLSTSELAEYFLVLNPKINAAMAQFHRDQFHDRDRDEMLHTCRKTFKHSGVGSVL